MVIIASMAKAEEILLAHVNLHAVQGAEDVNYLAGALNLLDEVLTHESRPLLLDPQVNDAKDRLVVEEVDPHSSHGVQLVLQVDDPHTFGLREELIGRGQCQQICIDAAGKQISKLLDLGWFLFGGIPHKVLHDKADESCDHKPV